jgi:hypothetical protein
MDVNWQRNPRGANTQADIPPDLARKLAAKWGLTWGGDWQGADRDPMHFEVARGSGPGTDHPTGVATGWKANNPLNLTTDTGGVVTPGGARLASFGSMADGVAATAAKLQSYQTDRGLNTVRQMYTEWHKGSPVNEADMQRVAGAMGVGVDQPFQLDPTKTAAWITAAQPGETGTAGKRLSQADITAGVRQAAAAPAVAPGGVAARTGGTDVAGPGAGSGASTAPPAALPRDQAVAQAQPTIPPPPEVLSNGLTREQTAEIPALRRAVQLGQKTLAEADKQLLDYQAANRAAQRQYTLDVQAQQKAATEQARQAEELRLRQEADKRTAAEAEVKAKQAAQPFQGTGMDPQWQNILDKGDDGSAKYARAYTAAAAPKYNPADGSWVKPNMAAYDKPTFVPKGMTEPPDYTKQEVPTPTIMTAPQTLAAGYADRMRNALPVISDTSPAAMSRWQQLLGQIPLAGNTFVSSDFQQHVQAERDFINAVLRRESGAAISEPEFINARQQYIPQPGDKPAVLAQKQKNRETVMANLVRDAGPAYRPPTGSATEPPASTPPSRVIRYDHTGKRIEE